MTMNLQKLEDENSLVNSVFKEELDHSFRNERLPIFEVIVNALDDM